MIGADDGSPFNRPDIWSKNMTPHELAEKICCITDYEIPSEIEALLTEARMEWTALQRDYDIENTVKDAVAAERNECAKVAEEAGEICHECGVQIAAQIRRRGETLRG